jgi:hypothetical protein
MLLIFCQQYLNHEPTQDELRHILQKYENEGFAGCRDSKDCLNLHWNDCPYQLKGQYKKPQASKLASVCVKR